MSDLWVNERCAPVLCYASPSPDVRCPFLCTYSQPSLTNVLTFSCPARYHRVLVVPPLHSSTSSFIPASPPACLSLSLPVQTHKMRFSCLPPRAERVSRTRDNRPPMTTMACTANFPMKGSRAWRAAGGRPCLLELVRGRGRGRGEDDDAGRDPTRRRGCAFSCECSGVLVARAL